MAKHKLIDLCILKGYQRLIRDLRSHQKIPVDRWQRSSFPKVIFISKVSVLAEFILYLPAATEFGVGIKNFEATDMELDVWLLPVLATGIAVYSANLNPDDKAHPRRIKVLIALLIGGCVFQIYFGVQKQKENKTNLLSEQIERKNIQRNLTTAQKQLTVAAEERKNIQGNLTTAQKQLTDAAEERGELLKITSLVRTKVSESQEILEMYFVNAGASQNTISAIDNDTIETSLKADKVLQQTTSTKVSSISTVWYFRKKVDEDLNPEGFMRILRGRGLDVVEKVASAKMESKRLNAIFYGKDVPEEEARTVALVLMRAGVRLKWFGYTSSAGKKNVIQIGAIAKQPFVSYRPWTVEEVQSKGPLAAIGNPEH